MRNTETIWNDFSARLLKFIRKRVEDEAAAEDLLQEVFVRIHTHVQSLMDEGRIESWVYQIARNAIIDHYRKRGEFIEFPETIPTDAIPDQPNAAELLSHSLLEMIETLPEPYRQALVLTEYRELTQAQLAATLGLSLSGAKSRVQRARQKIKDALLRCCHFELDRYGQIIDYWEHCCCCTNKLK